MQLSLTMKVMGRLDPEKRADGRAAEQRALADFRKTKRLARQAEDAAQVVTIWQMNDPACGARPNHFVAVSDRPARRPKSLLKLHFMRAQPILTSRTCGPAGRKVATGLL
jgi:hypothetical protein